MEHDKGYTLNELHRRYGLDMESPERFLRDALAEAGAAVTEAAFLRDGTVTVSDGRRGEDLPDTPVVVGG